MSHDLEAPLASEEIKTLYKQDPGLAFRNPPDPKDLDVWATREGRSDWPIADGVISILCCGTSRYDVAVEYKRQNEGLHGTLTALGQAHAYIHKGFAGSVMVLPRRYLTHPDPGDHIRAIVETTSDAQPISVFVYEDPDTGSIRPFKGRIQCLRPLGLDGGPPPTRTARARRTETQWAHIREGDCTPDYFFRYLQIALHFCSHGAQEPRVSLPRPLRAAVQRREPGSDELKFLSKSAIAGDDFHDKVWRNFWFEWVFCPDNRRIWLPRRGGQYFANMAETRLRRADGQGLSVLFCRRKDSIRQRLVVELNDGQIGEQEAWEQYAVNVRARAHSLREDVDSCLEALRMLTPEGRPSELGERFCRACEVLGDPNTGTPRAIFQAALIQHGQFGALLHYIFRLSEGKFREEPLAFARGTRRGSLTFDSLPYRQWLEHQLAEGLNVLRKVSARGGVSRKPLQSEISMLRHYGCASKYRIGVGLEINWPEVQRALEFPLE